MRLYFALGLISMFALLSGSLYFVWQSREYWKTETEIARAERDAVREQHAKQEVIINDYVKKLNDINERHNARVMRYGMSCELAPAEGVNGEGNAPRFGDPYPEISAYQAGCERIAEKLDKLQQAVGE